MIQSTTEVDVFILSINDRIHGTYPSLELAEFSAEVWKVMRGLEFKTKANTFLVDSIVHLETHGKHRITIEKHIMYINLQDVYQKPLMGINFDEGC